MLTEQQVLERPGVLEWSPPASIALRSEPVIKTRVTERLHSAKRSFVTRRAALDRANNLSRDHKPATGDLVLAAVVELGHHRHLESPHGRRAQLYVGDEIIVAYGARYAPDQFHAVVPDTIGPCNLVAGGGIAAQVRAKHARTRAATTIVPIGTLEGADGQPLNLRQFTLPPLLKRAAERCVIAVVGTSMNAGKTTLAASIIHGLAADGVRVGACKITGTGSGGDLWSMLDAGATKALDFTDAGHSTTAGLELAETEAIADLLVSHLESSDIDVVVVEIADGLLQRETSALLSAPSEFAKRIDSLLLAAADSMGAHCGADWLSARGLPLRAVSGLLTASPLATLEARTATGVDVFATSAFAEPSRAACLCLRSQTRDEG